MPVTFGELTALAEDHLRYAGRQDLTNATEPELLAITCALAACTSRVADLIAMPRHRPRNTDPNPAWRLATATVTEALTKARGGLASTVSGLSPRQSDFNISTAARLLSGRIALGASHDLLATHLDPTSSGPAYRTPAAATIEGTAARRQLTVATSTFASHLAPLAEQLSRRLTNLDAARADQLLTVAGHLATATAATKFVRHRDEQERSDIRDVPAVEPLRRHPPQAGETPEQLLHQAMASARRLHLVAFRDLSSGASDHHSAGTLAAVASAMVTSLEAQRRLLDYLSRSAQPAGGVDMVGYVGSIDAAAESTRLAAVGWDKIRHQWAGVRGLPCAVGDQGVRGEAVDITVRLSSLADALLPLSAADGGSSHATQGPHAFGNPTRWLDELAEFRIVQQQIAVSHARLTETLSRAGQLLVPTRTLTEEEDVPRPWAPMPKARVSSLTTAYTEIQPAVIARDVADRTADIRDHVGAAELTDRSRR